MSSSIPRILRLLPVAALLVAIGAQAVLMQTTNADRQAGSGFAMFSSVDHAGSRFVSAETVRGEETIPVPLPPTLNAELDALLIQPTNDRAAAFATLLRDQGWDLSGPEIGVEGDDRLESVTVTVRALTADGRTLSAKILAQASMP